MSDPIEGGLECYDQDTGESYFLAYADSDKYVALPPDDARTLLEYCANGSSGKL